jgi:hypothetical protein
MKISERNYNRIEKLYFFCWLYTAHRDFDLAKKIAKNKPLNWEQAENLSNFCNQIVITKQSTPQDFISDENESSDYAIDRYLDLKDCINQIKCRLGAKTKDKLYKSVKAFYRKKIYCYQMDSYYVYLINGLFMYANNIITYDVFLNNYCFEISLFNGKRRDIDLKYTIKMSNYILTC